MMNKFYTVKEFSDLLRCHPNTVRKMIHEKRLHPVNIGSEKKPTYSIPEDDLFRLMAQSFEIDIEEKGEEDV
jgi:excisionase family DNA binding protein